MPRISPLSIQPNRQTSSIYFSSTSPTLPTHEDAKAAAGAFDFSSNAPSRRVSSVLNLSKHYMASSAPAPVKTAKYPGHKRSFSLVREGQQIENGQRNLGTTVEEEDSNNASQRSSRSSLGFPFLRALHSFDPSSLTTEQTSEEDVADICLKFEDGDIALLHSVHSSGWGDATVLTTGNRGWIPTNYFVAYSDEKVVPLLTAILQFVLRPRSYELNRSEAEQPMYTFSQAAITNIVAGVRSLLEACGTLTRDTATVKKSQTIRKFRKNLLAELAILVSLAKQHRNSTEESVIQRLISGCYKIASKAIVFLDIWSIDTSTVDDDYNEPEYITTTNEAAAKNNSPPLNNQPDTADEEEQHIKEARTALEGGGKPPVTETETGTLSMTKDGFAIPRKPRDSKRVSQHGANRESVIFHSAPPLAGHRLDEVNDALTAYLGIFIHRMPFLESNPTASTQILVNTRKSMLACRELLACVEAVSSKQHPRSRELEQAKDKLFAQIRTLVTSARDVVASTSPKLNDESPRPDVSPAGQTLIENAVNCARTAGECLVRCRVILNKVGDFQMTGAREYPDFSDGVIAMPSYNRTSRQNSVQDPASPIPGAGFGGFGGGGAVPTTGGSSNNNNMYGARATTNTGSTSQDKVVLDTTNQATPTLPSLTTANPSTSSDSILPQIPALSPIIPAHSTDNSPSEPYFHTSNFNGAASKMMTMNNTETQQDPMVVDQDEFPAELQVIQDPNTHKIRGGSLQVLINLISDESRDPDEYLISMFFLTFRNYATPQEVYDCLVARYALNVDEDTLDLKTLEDISSRRVKVFNIFKRWLESHWRQSADGVVLGSILWLADEYFGRVLPNASAKIHDLARQVQSNLLTDGEPIVARVVCLPDGRPARPSDNYFGSSPPTCNTLSRQQVSNLTRVNETNGYRLWNPNQPKAAAVLASTDEFMDTKSVHTTATATTSSAWSSSLKLVRNSTFAGGSSSHGVSVMDFEPIDIATQLTMMDSNMFCQINTTDLAGVNLFKRNVSQSPNINTMITFTNQLGVFVSDSILANDMTPKQRKNVLKQWIKVAERCVELKNFNSMMGIVSTLHTVNIQRLKKTWETLSPRYHAVFASLKEVASPERNFSNYRAQLKIQETPCVPYLGVYTQDLTFLVEGNVKTRKFLLPHDSSKMIRVINFDLYERITKVVGEVQKFQVPYRLGASRELQTWIRGEMLRANAHTDQNELWRRSCIVEPKQ